MSEIKLIASDMDMTFLKADGTYNHERFTKLLDRLEQEGTHFAVASGRSLWMVEDIFGDLSSRLDYVVENGAYVLAQGKVVADPKLAAQEIADFEAFFVDKPEAFLLAAGAKGLYYRGKMANYSSLETMPTKLVELFEKGQSLADFSQIPRDEEIFKMTAIVPVTSVEAISAEYNNQSTLTLKATPSGYGAIDFIKEGYHKAWGLEQLLKHYGLSQNQLMVFGDDVNDLEMMRFAGQAYAMENAKSAVKAAANQVIASNEAEGVLATIEAYLAKI